MKPEAALAKAILLNTRGKELFTALDCFVSAFVEAFRQCNDCVQNIKSNSIRAITLEREFSTLRNESKLGAIYGMDTACRRCLFFASRLPIQRKKFKKLSNNILPKDRFIYVVAILGFAKIWWHGKLYFAIECHWVRTAKAAICNETKVCCNWIQIFSLYFGSWCRTNTWQEKYVFFCRLKIWKCPNNALLPSNTYIFENFQPAKFLNNKQISRLKLSGYHEKSSKYYSIKLSMNKV